MRPVTPIVAVAAALLAAVAAQATPSAPTALRIAGFADGRKPETKVVWTLRCDPVGGSLPRRSAACRELARRGRQTLLPVPPGTACTEIYGGPQVAIVTGTIDGRPVWARLRRDDGCQIDRWERNRFLLPIRLS